MIDRTFTAALAFAMLAFGAAAFTSLATETAAPRQVQLERVVITAKRLAPDLVGQVVASSDSATVAAR